MKLKILTLILVTILSINIVLAESKRIDNYNDISELTMNFKIEGGFSLQKQNQDSKIGSVTSYLTFFPQDDILQKIQSKNEFSTPNAKVSKDSLEVVFNWDSPPEKSFKFGV